MTTFLSSLWAACAQHFSKRAPRASCGATGERGKHSSCLWRAWREHLFITSAWAGSSTHPGAAPPKHHSLSVVLLPTPQTPLGPCGHGPAGFGLLHEAGRPEGEGRRAPWGSGWTRAAGSTQEGGLCFSSAQDTDRTLLEGTEIKASTFLCLLF